MNRDVVTDAVIEHWREKAGNRRTVVFCSTVDHARNVTQAFKDADVSAAMIWGDMPDAERRRTLMDYSRGRIQVVVNVAVLTEGWDDPPTSCVVLLRPSSYKSTLIQMVGRGLRPINPEEHPGVVKTDCIVLDFGTSSLIHGSLEQEVDLEGRDTAGDAPTKDCPECGAIVPIATMECPLCGYVWVGEEHEDLQIGDFVMSEIDLLARSSFQWVDLFGDDVALVASGFDAWAGIFLLDNRWYAVGGRKRAPARLLSIGERMVCLAAADDWINDIETEVTAHKTRRWLNLPPSEGQLKYLPAEARADLNLTRYQASAWMTFKINKRSIERLVYGARGAMAA
jgi:hypothetical protein